MNFVTLEFALFFLVMLTIWWASQRAPALRRAFLLAANLFFYAATGITFIPLLLATACINWGVATGMSAPGPVSRTQNNKGSQENTDAAHLAADSPDTERQAPLHRKAWLVAGISANLCLLAFFKYYEFLAMELSTLTGLHLPMEAMLPSWLVDMAFPIGISFYIFQGIAYIVEQYRDPALRPQSLFQVLLYLSFFPTVLSGPILRPGQFFPQLDALTARPGLDTEQHAARENTHAVPEETSAAKGASPAVQAGFLHDPYAVQEGFALILSGLFKKVVLASYLADHVVRDAFQGPEGYSSWGILLAVYGYSMQIYCDFSGYTDMALGVGRLMGFRLPQNFASPYLACDIQDFWRRWHMTLSSWLRDYLYIPLGGSRYGHTYRNLLLTMFLGGLWHGAHTRFIVWGLMHGLGLCLVHAFQTLRKRLRPDHAPSRLWRAFAWLLTFHFVTVTWIFFGAENMDRSLEILRRIIFWGQEGAGFPIMALPAIACAMLIQVVGGHVMRSLIHVQLRLPLPAQAAVSALLCVIILRMGPDGVLPFIYFQF